MVPGFQTSSEGQISSSEPTNYEESTPISKYPKVPTTTRFYAIAAYPLVKKEMRFFITGLWHAIIGFHDY